jgi:hypothetical protein
MQLGGAEMSHFKPVLNLMHGDIAPFAGIFWCASHEILRSYPLKRSPEIKIKILTSSEKRLEELMDGGGCSGRSGGSTLICNSQVLIPLLDKAGLKMFPRV